MNKIKNLSLKELSLALKRTFNKVYCRDIDTLLAKVSDSVDLTPSEKQAIRFLIQDLNSLKNKADKKEKYGRFI